jgi:hypothetical protein
MNNYGMQPKKRFSFSKKKDDQTKESTACAEQIKPADLPSLVGTIVLWKKNDKDFYSVRLGEAVVGTDCYKIYSNETSGICCPESELYKYIEHL